MDPSKPNARLRSHPEAEGVQTHVRQSVLYSDRPKRSRRRRPALHVEHPSEAGSSQLDMEVTDFEALSVSDSYSASPSETMEHPSEVRSSELGSTVTDMPAFEALSLSEPQPLALQIAEETDDDDADSHLRPPGDTYSFCPKGVTRSMLSSLGDLWTTVSVEELRRPYSNEDPEELRREINEYLDALPCVSLDESFARVRANEHATLTALAVEWGTEPPRNPFLVDQAPQQASAAAAQRQHSLAQRKPRSEDGKDWMRDEVMLCFEKHIERNVNLKPLEYKLDKLCHQCFNVESYNNVYHHYNFIIMMKMSDSDDWTVELYFAEVHEMFRRKFYFCSTLEPNENGNCYACKNQGMEDLKHPATGGFEAGSPDAPESSFWCWDEDE